MAATAILIKGGRVISPASGVDRQADVYIKDGVVRGIGFFDGLENAEVISASGCWVTPGFIDLHAHLREPGQTYKETIETGARAAAAGGFTAVCCMPNTEPYADTAEVLEYIIKAAKNAPVRILPVAGITRGQRGETLAPMDKLAAAVAFSEDGKPVADAALMRAALKNAAALNRPVFSHCEDLSLTCGGVVHKGIASEKYGLPGIPPESETYAVGRDIKLAVETGARLHICHVSAAGSVDLIKKARDETNGASITAEVCPHHFAFCDEDIETDDGRYKMNPPLRARRDRYALIEGLKNGVIPVIATDHAPHAAHEKDKGLSGSAFGVVGLETAVSAGITYLVNTGALTPFQFIKTLTENPACVLGIEMGAIRPGAAADITITDPGARYTVNPSDFFSKGRSTPFEGAVLTGRVKTVIVNGSVVYKYETGAEHAH